MKISDMDVLSVRNAQRMMSAVDGALRKVDAERGDLGATMNRMEHTIDNLSNIVVNTTVSRGRIEDADMAEDLLIYLKVRFFNRLPPRCWLRQTNRCNQF